MMALDRTHANDGLAWLQISQGLLGSSAPQEGIWLQGLLVANLATNQQVGGPFGCRAFWLQDPTNAPQI